MAGWGGLGPITDDSSPAVGHRRIANGDDGVSFIGDLKWKDHHEYEWSGEAWIATGNHEAGWTNTPRAGEPEGSRDRKPTAPNLDGLLNERQSTHGDFGDNAKISQATKTLWRSFPGWERLDDDMKEVLEMEALKIGRILSGKPTEPDHWVDNAGYPQMIANRLRFGKYKV